MHGIPSRRCAGEVAQPASRLSALRRGGRPRTQRAAAVQQRLDRVVPRLVLSEAATQRGHAGHAAHHLRGEAEPGEEAVGVAVLGRHVAADLLAPAGVGVEGDGAHQLAGDPVLAGVGHDVELVDGDAGGVRERRERARGGDGEPDRLAVGGRDVGADVLAVQGGRDATLGRGPGGHLGADAGLDAGGHPELGEGPLLVRRDTPDADHGTAHRGFLHRRSGPAHHCRRLPRPRRLERQPSQDSRPIRGPS